MRLDKLFKCQFITSDGITNGDETNVRGTKKTGFVYEHTHAPVHIADKYKKTYQDKVLGDYMNNKLSIISLSDNMNDLLKNKYFLNDGMSWEESLAYLPNEQTCFHFPINSQDALIDEYGMQQMYMFFQKEDTQVHTAMMSIDTPKLNKLVTVHALQIAFDDFENCTLYRDPQKFNTFEDNNDVLNAIEYNEQTEHWKAYIDWMTHFTMNVFIVLTKFLANDKIVADALINQMPPAKVVRKALKNNNFPPVRYKTLVLKKYKTAGVKTGYVFPNRAKPSEHTRRGHIRIVNGVKVPVRPCVVNKNKGTRIIKDYIVSQ